MLDHLANRQDGPALSFSDETDALLETGGGVLKALPFFDSQPFFTINSDVIWTDDNDLALHRLAESFDPETMDALLLLSPREQAIGHPGAGDFFIDRAIAGASEIGPLIWRGEADTAPFIYASIHISHQALYRDPPEGAFRLTDLWQRASSEGRLFGLVHHGKWHDVGNPDGRDQAEQMLRDLRA
jgi:MurNAc alpha-1-phosphate uridylyltransferase